MKLNNKGFLITGILYSLLLLFLVLIIGMVAILNARQKKIDYISYDIITKLNDKYDFNVARVWNFDYTGDYQTFTVPSDGYYQVELWGAEGGSNVLTAENTSGRGAYTKGIIYLTKGENIYIYVGGKVTNEIGTNGYYDTEGGYNGGGPGESPGGGATDIRLTSGNWDDFNSLKSRIMVAAGGGGGVYSKNTYVGTQRGDGGTLYGIDANFSVTTYGYGYSGHGATQTLGGKPGEKFSGSLDPVETEIMTGKFGAGGYGINANGKYTYSSSGGGGGYYGGGHGNHPANSWPGGGGGSSFISGYFGCDAISAASTENAIIHTGQPNHYSGKVFSNSIMIAGDSDMPTYDGTSTMTGNTGNGYAKISLLSTSPQSYTITNLIENGSFENELTGWAKRDDKSILELDNTKVLSGSTSLKVTANSDNSVIAIVSDKYKVSLGHIYYTFANITPYNFDHNITVRLGYVSTTDAGGTSVYGAYIGNDLKGSTKSTNFVKVSYLYTFDKATAKFESDGTTFNTISIWNNTNTPSNTGEYFNVDDVLVVDLTETFGAGNEPTKEWCDENISYFDGTTTIYK